MYVILCCAQSCRRAKLKSLEGSIYGVWDHLSFCAVRAISAFFFLMDLGGGAIKTASRVHPSAGSILK